MTSRLAIPVGLALLALASAEGASGAFLGVSSPRAQWFENQASPSNPLAVNESFGAALAAGDFNGDGAMDLATGVPWDTGESSAPVFDAGAVVIRWGVPDRGLATGPPDTVLSAYAAGSHLAPADSKYFGVALAAGDFNGDGRDDLAVGAPGSRPGPGFAFNWGAVIIHYGLPSGIQTAGEHFLMEGINGVPNPEDGVAYLGAALAAGDFDGDGYDDLAMGGSQKGGQEIGLVIVVHGHVGGLLPFVGYLVRQGLAGRPDSGEEFDHFGAALASGNFDGDERCTDVCRPLDDLAIAAPGEDDEGAVMVVFGSTNGVESSPSTYLRQATLGGSGGELGDQFGLALAAGDFNGDLADELVIGTPFEDLGAGIDTGEVTVVAQLTAASHGPVLFLNQGGIFGNPAYNQTNDKLGKALAAADLDRDGADDLVIGLPGEAVGGVGRGGIVVLTGQPLGLYHLYGFLPPGTSGIPPAVPENLNAAGAALAAGDFDGDGHPDLAIGLPGRYVGSSAFAGAEVVLYGALFSDGFEGGSTFSWSASAP